MSVGNHCPTSNANLDLLLRRGIGGSTPVTSANFYFADKKNYLQFFVYKYFHDDDMNTLHYLMVTYILLYVDLKFNSPAGVDNNRRLRRLSWYRFSSLFIKITDST